MIGLYAYVNSHLQQLKDRAESGQSMAEYAVILAVITAGIIVALGVLSTQIGTVLTRISAAIN
jgi:Flp pilus assembly pilin Flp